LRSQPINIDIPIWTTDSASGELHLHGTVTFSRVQ
jgi:hypothetical protein